MMNARLKQSEEADEGQLDYSIPAQTMDHPWTIDGSPALPNASMSGCIPAMKSVLHTSMYLTKASRDVSGY
jgi:hypothetical protein